MVFLTERESVEFREDLSVCMGILESLLKKGAKILGPLFALISLNNINTNQPTNSIQPCGNTFGYPYSSLLCILNLVYNVHVNKALK